MKYDLIGYSKTLPILRFELEDSRLFTEQCIRHALGVQIFAGSWRESSVECWTRMPLIKVSLCDSNERLEFRIIDKITTMI